MTSDTSSAAAIMPVLEALLVFALLTFVFHFTWEILQAPLFDRMPVMSHWQATLVCLKATFGDVWIALASFAVGAWREKSWRWFVNPSCAALAVYLATGVLITIAFEWHALYWADRWSYSDLMPLVPLLQVGLAPVLQWLVLPLAVLFFLRSHSPMLGSKGL